MSPSRFLSGGLGARDSYGDAVAAEQQHDTASVQGAIDYLASLGATVGVYSTAYQWGQITGGAALNVSVPDWVAGAADATQAAAYCTGQSFTGPGAVTALTQYQSGGFDVDHPCA